MRAKHGHPVAAAAAGETPRLPLPPTPEVLRATPAAGTPPRAPPPRAPPAAPSSPPIPVEQLWSPTAVPRREAETPVLSTPSRRSPAAAAYRPPRSPVAAPVVGAAHAGSGDAMGSLIQKMRAALGADDADGDADDREAAYAPD